MISSWSIGRWLNGEPRHRLGLALFQRAIGLSLLFRVITELPFAAFLWGPHSIASEGSIGSVFGADAGGWADAMFRSDAGTYAVLGALAAGAAGLLFQRLTRISALIACIAFNVLGARLPELQDGGDNLATLALMYMVLLLPAGANAAAGSIRVWLHNLGASAVIMQVCIVYFVAGFMKMYGDSWHNGTALYLISQVEWFSSPATRSWFANPIIATSGAYSTMLFQVWFPIALLSRLKFAFLAMAMVFHLGIAVSMGLLTFSLIMAGADLSLVSDAEYRRIIRRVRHHWRQLRDRRFATAILFIDGDCAFCRAFGRRVAGTKAIRPIAVQSFRDSASYEDYLLRLDRLERQMHLVVIGERGPEVFAGFEVLPLLAWRLPLLWPFIPALRVIGRLGLGGRLYRLVATRRLALAIDGPCGHRCMPRW